MTIVNPNGKLKHKTMSAALLDEIRQRILDGRYQGGSQLRQDALADEFGTSRIPVREALFQLEAEGFVRILPHRGATVSTLSAEDVAEAFDLRIVLEPQLLRFALPHLTAADLAEMDRVLEDYSQALKVGDTARWGQLNTEFHLLLYRHAGRKRTLMIVTSLLQECDRYTRVQLSSDVSKLERADREHRELVRLCRAGDTAEAVRLLRAHIEQVGQELRTFLTPAHSKPRRPTI